MFSPGSNLVLDGAIQRVLGKINGNFQVTTDQTINITASVYTVTGIIITNASTNLSVVTSPVGGFYPAASKGGTALVSAAQAYSSLTASSVLLFATLTAGALATRYTASQLFFSLTTAASYAATADIYVIGIDLS